MSEEIQLRAATLADVPALLPRARALNAHEGIEVEAAAHEAALRRLIDDPELGGVWIVEDGGTLVGYTIVTYGYDLEFAGRDAWLTELWLDATARGRGSAAQVLELLDTELRAREVRALHLQVRPDNPAQRLYERAGFEQVPRLLMTRRMR